jgi:regulatory protein
MTTRTRRDPNAEPIADPDAAREAALKLLERTRRTRVDLERRLRDKGFAAETIAGVLDRLAHVGLIDDTEYARAFLAGRWGRRPSGWRKLQQQLRGKGVSEADVAAARARIEERDGAIDELATARKLIAVAMRRYATLEPRVRQQRLYALLARRGYDGELIRRALAIPDGEASE